MNTVRDRHTPRFEHLVIQSLLFHIGQFIFQFVLINGLADRGRGDGRRDLFAKDMLLTELFPDVIAT